MNETLIKLDHDFDFVSGGLREALNKSTAVESIILFIPRLTMYNRVQI